MPRLRLLWRRQSGAGWSTTAFLGRAIGFRADMWEQKGSQVLAFTATSSIGHWALERAKFDNPGRKISSGMARE